MASPGAADGRSPLLKGDAYEGDRHWGAGHRAPRYATSGTREATAGVREEAGSPYAPTRSRGPGLPAVRPQGHIGGEQLHQGRRVPAEDRVQEVFGDAQPIAESPRGPGWGNGSNSSAPSGN